MLPKFRVTDHARPPDATQYIMAAPTLEQSTKQVKHIPRPASTLLHQAPAWWDSEDAKNQSPPA